MWGKWGLVCFLVSGGVAAKCTAVLQHRRQQVYQVGSPGDQVVKTEEFARYPCEKLLGFDVVVRNIFIRRHGKNAASMNNENSVWSRVCDRVRGVFSNENNTLMSSPADAEAFENSLASVRETPGGVSAMAAATWVPLTEKFSAMVIEPSRTVAPTASAEKGLHPNETRGVLRVAMDSATSQSVVKCDPRGPASKNCQTDPSFLSALYLRVMLLALTLFPFPLPPLRVGVIGVGGGSIPTFLLRYFSRNISHMDLVDVEPAVFRAAVQDMGLSSDPGCQTRYYVDDALLFLRRSVPVGPLVNGDVMQRGSSLPDRPYDVLFIDTFVGSEIPKHITGTEFHQLCRNRLSSIGVVAFNTPVLDNEFVNNCAAVFGKQNVFVLPVPQSANVVVLAKKESLLSSPMSHRHFVRRAKHLETTFQLPYDLSAHLPVWWVVW